VAVEEAYIPVIVYRVSDGTQAMEYRYSHLRILGNHPKAANGNHLKTGQ